MRPRPSGNHLANLAHAGMKFTRYILTCNAFRSACSDSANGFRRKHGSSVSNPAFRNHIYIVVTICSKEKMIRAHTWRIVTPVQNKESVCDRAVMDNPRTAVRSYAESTSIASAAYGFRSRANNHPSAHGRETCPLFPKNAYRNDGPLCGKRRSNTYPARVPPRSTIQGPWYYMFHNAASRVCI